MWTYMPYGPFSTLPAYRDWIDGNCMGDDPLFFAIVDSSGSPAGVASFLRIQPKIGVMEVGHIAYAPPLQRVAAGTEAMYLMMHRAFEDLGYRRYEWKCDALNAASRQAADRLGFTFEGIFRQATIYKGRNRDTAWYSVIDREWPILRKAFERWLDPANFDSKGAQLRRLARLRAECLSEAGLPPSTDQGHEDCLALGRIDTPDPPSSGVGGVASRENLPSTRRLTRSALLWWAGPS